MNSGITALTVLLLFAAHEAMAGERLPAPRNERYQAECGSCHLAYPPRLLTAPAWRGVIGGLGRHFGTDASVDPAAAAEIGAFLERNAGSRRAGDGPRITESRWFVRKHDELPAGVWRRPSVNSAANCAACHTAAEQGDFRERNIRIPR